MKKDKAITYKEAGVDIDAGNALVHRIKPLAKATHRVGAMGGLGGFGALFDLKKTGYDDPILVSSTDGVGTKLLAAQAMGKHNTIGIDLVAMCVNDLVVQGAEPLFFLDYFATGKLDVDVAAQVIQGIAEGCKQANCALVGGETAEMPGMYKAEEYDLAGFAVGAVERQRMLPRQDIHQGDVLLGLASSGIHSNGFSLVRRIMQAQGVDYATPVESAAYHTLGEALLEPTRIYVKSCLTAIRAFQNEVKALAHITGGGITENLPRVLPEHLAAEIDPSAWPMPPLFYWLQEAGNVPLDNMRLTFNCGIGMVVVVSAGSASAVKLWLEKEGETVYRLGTLAPRKTEAVIYHE